MSVTLGPRLGLMLNAAAGDAHPNEFRAFLRGMDALCQISAKSRTTAAQPSSPTNGDTYILPSGATGTAWGGKAAGTIAYYTTQQTTTSGGTENTASGWDFITPKRGFYANVEDESDAIYNFDGTAWQIFYKTGTWTPTATNLTGTGIAYATKWTKLGNRVDFNIVITGTGIASTNGKLTLPFTPAQEGSVSVLNATSTTLFAVAQVFPDGNVYLYMGSATASKLDITGTFYTN